MLRAFLNHLDHDPAAVRLADEGGSAFVSLSLRPFVVAALADQDARRPALIVVGDDRAARDLAADLRAWLAPAAGPLLPEPRRRLRVAPDAAAAPRRPARRGARRADRHARGLRAAGRRDLAPSRSRRRCPTRSCARTASCCSVGDLLDLDETAQQLVAAGYQRVDQVEDRGQFAIRGGLLDVYPATEERAVRVDLFDIEIEALRWFSTFTQRSLGETDCVEISPAAELAPEHRELAEIAATDEDRPDIAELLPVEHFHALLELIPERTQIIVAAEEDVEPTLRDHWEDVCTAFDDQDARDLYVNPAKINEALARARRGAPVQHLRRPADRDPRPGRRLRRAQPARGRVRAREARRAPTTRPSSPGRSSAPPSAPRTTSPASRRRLNGGTRGLVFTEASLRDGFVAPGPEARRVPRAPADPPQEGEHAARRARAAGCCASFTDLRTGDHIVHEDHGIARFAGFDTKTVAGVTRDYLNLEFQGDDKVFMPVDQLAKISRYLGADGGAPTLSKLGGTRWDKVKARARRAAQELAGELLQPLRRAQAPPRPRVPGVLRGAARPRGQLPVPRDARPARRDRQRDRRHGVRAPDGPPDLRRRRLRQDRGRAARRGQGGVSDGKQVLMLVPTTILAQQHYGTFIERLRDQPFEVEHVSRFRTRRRSARGGQALHRGQGRHPDRHAPAALARRAREGPRAAGGRRGAALRRQAEGADAPAQAQGRRDLDERDADPAHAADVARRPARHLA